MRTSGLFHGRSGMAALAVAISAVIGACQAQSPPASAPPPPNGASGELAAATSRVNALIGDAACDSASQCRTIGRGSKACGGPGTYAAWSTKTTDAAALQAAVRQEQQATEAVMAGSGRVSNCMVQADPGARCEQKRCVTGSGGAATR
jgi:hypothetical protein